MTYHQKLHIPHSCEINQIIAKDIFYKQTDITKQEKVLIKKNIARLTCLYSIKPDTINIKAYKDHVREYEELLVIQMAVREDSSLNRLAEIMMKTIPYPMLLFLVWEEKIKLCAAHQRTNQNDPTKNTLEEMVATEWLQEDSPLFDKLNITHMSFRNLYALYDDLLSAIYLFKAEQILAKPTELTPAEARELTLTIQNLDEEITVLKSKLKRETQFNRKMEMNIQIKNMENQRQQLTGGKKP